MFYIEIIQNNKAGSTLKKGGRCYFHEILYIWPIFKQKLIGNVLGLKNDPLGVIWGSKVNMVKNRLWSHSTSLERSWGLLFANREEIWKFQLNFPKLYLLWLRGIFAKLTDYRLLTLIKLCMLFINIFRNILSFFPNYVILFSHKHLLYIYTTYLTKI